MKLVCLNCGNIQSFVGSRTGSAFAYVNVLPDGTVEEPKKGDWDVEIDSEFDEDTIICDRCNTMHSVLDLEGGDWGPYHYSSFQEALFSKLHIFPTALLKQWLLDGDVCDDNKEIIAKFLGGSK